MVVLQQDIKVIPGVAHMLLIAPHGLSEDDENTDRLTRQVARRLACAAIINAGLPRKRLDLNIIPQAERHPAFIPAITQIIARAGHTRVIWLHGMRDQSASIEARNLNIETSVHCLIGCGQPDRLSAKRDTVERLMVRLQASGLNTYVAADRRSKFRGYSARNMNQWFRNNGYPLSRVESLQLELSWSGVREEGSIDRTARVLSDALKQLMNLDS